MKSRIKTICSATVLTAGLLVAAAMPAAAAPHAFVRGGGFGYRGVWGGGWGGWGGWGGGWGGWGPWGYGYFPSYGFNPNRGEVKLDTKLKDAEVFINGSYAGTVREMKTMWMRQGSYDLEIRAPGREEFQSRIYVVNGKTIHIRPDLRVKS